MKKMIVLLLCAAMLLTLCACGEKKDAAPVQEVVEDAPRPLLGGWEKQEYTYLTVEVQELLEKATEKLVGASYTPVAFLATQVVAGRNYALLCRVAPVVPNPSETWAIVKLYEDAQGNVSLSDVIDSGVATHINGLAGGWSQCENPSITEEVKALFDKALNGYKGAALTPVALAATQVVAGTNYCFLCETDPVTVSTCGYAMVTVYADLKGNAEITDVAEFPAA